MPFLKSKKLLGHISVLIPRKNLKEREKSVAAGHFAHGWKLKQVQSCPGNVSSGAKPALPPAFGAASGSQ